MSNTEDENEPNDAECVTLSRIVEQSRYRGEVAFTGLKD